MVDPRPYRPGTAPWLRVPAVRGFVARHGWRAYGLVGLSALTVATLLAPTPHHRPAPATVAAATRATSPAPTGAADEPQLAPTPTGSASSSPTGSSTTTTAVPAAASCATNHEARHVIVSIRLQHAWMCQGTTRVKDTAVTTGRDGADYTTPTGTWQVYGKQTDRDLVGPGYSEYVHYWVPYSGDFGFHDATWQTMPFGDQGYHAQGSHGCVHLPTAAMKWLYGWIAVGSTVTVTR